MMDKSNTLEYINQIFPTEASLSGVEPMMQKIRNEIRHVDAEILVAVRQQSNSGTKAKHDLALATQAIKELMHKIREIKMKAEQSEAMVQEICRDIKKLDFAKKHITTTITALHRLAMLVSAVEQLQEMATKRQYKEAAGQLEAVNQLCSHFEAYRDNPKITELREKFKNIKQILKSHVFSDFSSLGTARLKEDSNLMQQLADACLVVDAFEPSVREELIRTVCNKELTAYQQIFEGTEVAKLDKAERRYAWIKRQLRANEDIWQLFPHSWRVSYLLCIQFCKVTRSQLTDILDGMKEKPDVGTLLQALQRTLEFEEELAERFGGAPALDKDGESDTEELEDGLEIDKQNAAEIRKKYEKQRAARAGNETEPNRGSETAKELLAAGFGFNFRGIISSCFEAHLIIYVELEEKTLMENLEKLVQEETWEAEEGSQTNILSSSTQVFLMIKRSLKRCSALTKSQTLFNLFKVFQRILQAYAGKLSAKLPKGMTGIVATATGTDQIKISDKDERVICYIVNTAEYCHETAGQLAENIAKIIDAQFAEKVDMSEEQDEFSAVITRSLMTLVHGLETKLEIELAAMTRVPWAALESVGDQSGYVNGISTILSSSVPVLGGLLSPVYFQFFLDKLAASLAPRFHLNIYKCKLISETGAQQMLLDTHAVKTILLEVPSIGGQSAASPGYTKFVGREMGKAEALLKDFLVDWMETQLISLVDLQRSSQLGKFVKASFEDKLVVIEVILSPMESVADTYRALLPEGTAADFQRILDLKGLKKVEQQNLLDDFSRHSSGINIPQTSIVPAVRASPSPTAPSIIGAIASHEDVLTRAAALGRGAATTGFKRFLALTEAAKDKKEGPFRKLFNT